MNFKAGDRVWFEGVKYTLDDRGDCLNSQYVLCLKGYPGVSFTVDGKILSDGKKSSLKLVKKKQRRRIWLSEMVFNTDNLLKPIAPWYISYSAKPEHADANSYIEFVEVKK